MKAQIFLSCVQDSEERPIAQAIKERIEHPDHGLGFDCFVASEQQDLTGLREIVFRYLEEADYFVFIDFRREELKKDKAGMGIHRGSLTVEFKWAHTSLPAVRIAAKPSHRFFDAVWLFENAGRHIDLKFFNPIVPSPTDYFPHHLGPGRYRLSFTVVSDNFMPVRKNFIFEFGQTIESGKLSEAS